MRVALVLLLVLAVSCVESGMKREVELVNFTTGCGSGENFYRVYEKGSLTVVEFGVNLPNPCYEVKANLVGSTLSVDVVRKGGVCVQCLAYGEGVVSVKGDISTVEIYIDGSKVELERK